MKETGDPYGVWTEFWNAVESLDEECYLLYKRTMKEVLSEESLARELLPIHFENYHSDLLFWNLADWFEVTSTAMIESMTVKKFKLVQQWIKHYDDEFPADFTDLSLLKRLVEICQILNRYWIDTPMSKISILMRMPPSSTKEREVDELVRLLIQDLSSDLYSKIMNQNQS